MGRNLGYILIGVGLVAAVLIAAVMFVPATGENASRSMDAAVLGYACSSRPTLRDNTHVTGIAAARAYGRQAMAR